VVRRSAEGVELRRLAEADFALLRSLSRGDPLGDALQVALSVAADFDLAQALPQFVGLGVLARVHTN
jgi:hypothetical protein